MSDKPLDVYVLYSTDTEEKFIKVSDDGCLALFEDEESAKLAKQWNPNTDYKQVNFYSQKQVDKMQAEYKTLQAEYEKLRTKTSVALGVGDGSGDLFVYGDYDSVRWVQALILECEQLRKDAERYRWLRGRDNFPLDEGDGESLWDQLCEIECDEFDAFIDAVMEKDND